MFNSHLFCKLRSLQHTGLQEGLSSLCMSASCTFFYISEAMQKKNLCSVQMQEFQVVKQLAYSVERPRNFFVVQRENTEEQYPLVF